MTRSTRSKKERTQRSARTPKAPRLEAADQIVNAHPSAPVMNNYCLYRDRLSRETIEKVEAHLAVCERCRKDAEYGTEHADYFRRLMKAPIDC